MILLTHAGQPVLFFILLAQCLFRWVRMSESQPPPPPPTKMQLLRQFATVLRGNQTVAQKLVFYTVLMFTVPIATFLFLDRVVLPDFDIEEGLRNSIAAFVAVAVVQFVIAAYVMDAMREDSRGQSDVQAGDSKKED